MFGCQPAQIKTLTATQDRCGNLLRLGRGKEKLHVFGRFLQCLEQGVESPGAEHVDLVDQVHLVGTPGRCVSRVLPQRADAVDAVVAGTVNLHDIKAPPLSNLDAGVASAARVVGWAILCGEAVQGLRQDPRRGGFSHATRPHK